MRFYLRIQKVKSDDKIRQETRHLIILITEKNVIYQAEAYLANLG